MEKLFSKIRGQELTEELIAWVKKEFVPCIRIVEKDGKIFPYHSHYKRPDRINLILNKNIIVYCWLG